MAEPILASNQEVDSKEPLGRMTELVLEPALRVAPVSTRELTKIERKLCAIDNLDDKSCPKTLMSRDLDESREDLPYSRKLLIQEIDSRIKEHPKLMPFTTHSRLIGA